MEDVKKTQTLIAEWKKKNTGINKPSSKPPKPIEKTVYTCKRRKPQPIGDKYEIYQDPHDKKLTQFRTASNDGYLKGGCPFSILFNLHNIDDKAIVPSWLTKNHILDTYKKRTN